MDNKNGMVDVSCFLLVEDSGDSELDCGPNIMKQQRRISMDIGIDDDDAESCSCDTNERVDDFYVEEDQDLRVCNIEVEPVATAGLSSCCKMWSIDEALGFEYTISAGQQGEEESSFGMNLCREVMDSMEDRLFWETCIAVGYPGINHKYSSSI